MRLDRRSLVIVGGVGLGATTAPAQGRAQDGKLLIGGWSLVDADTIHDDGRVTPWRGQPKPFKGLIVYQPQGWVSVQIAAAREARPANGPPLTQPEKAAFYDSYYGYFGHFEVDAKSSVVTHRIVSSLNPDEIGIVYRRHYDLSGDTLTLKTLQDPNKPEDSYNRLVWRRQR